MKKPIDPNLGDSLDSELLTGESDIKLNKDEFEFNDYSAPKEEPKFSVKDKATGEEIDVNEKAVPAAMDPDKDYAHHRHHHHHHHHSSDGSHSSSDGSHHSSSGSHHSSSGSHHSSSGSHHSSSGSHHSSGSSHRSSSNSHRSSSKSGSSHHHHHHHHHSKKDKKKLPLPARIAIGLLVAIFIFTAVGVGTFLAFMLSGKSDFKPKAEDVKYQATIEYKGHKYEFNEDILAIGFIGVDQREFKTGKTADFRGAADADVVLAIDTKTGDAKAISIPRDTMVDIDVYTASNVFVRTQKAQLCLAYAYGDGSTQSCQNTIEAMSRVLLNVPITKYFALDLNGIKPLNDAVGGVTVTSLYDFEEQGIRKGDEVTLKGDMAELYVRERSMDDLNASLNRVDRQTQYIKAYAAQVIPAAMQDFSVVRNLYNTAQGYSQTNITLSNVTYLGNLFVTKRITDFDTRTIQGTMTASKDPVLEGVVHAEFTPDNDDVTEAVLDAFYTQVD